MGQTPNRTKATSLIFSGSVSSLSLFLQEMDVDRMHDDVKTEALAVEVWDGFVASSMSRFSFCIGGGSVGWMVQALGLYSAHGVDRKDVYSFIFAEIFQ